MRKFITCTNMSAYIQHIIEFIFFQYSNLQTYLPFSLEKDEDIFEFSNVLYTEIGISGTCKSE